MDQNQYKQPQLNRMDAGILKIPGAPYIIRLDDNIPIVPIRTLTSSNNNKIPLYARGYAMNYYPVVAERTDTMPEYYQEDMPYDSPSKVKKSHAIGSSQKAAKAKEESFKKLKTNRGVIKFWFFSLITLGFYAIYFWSKFAKELNIACEFDGKRTRGIIALSLLSIITLGIYAFIWKLKIVSRVNNGASYYKKRSKISVLSYILWNTIGQIIGGHIIAEVKLFRTMNKICKAYNYSFLGEQEDFETDDATVPK